MKDAKRFWAAQTSSLHRTGSPAFYEQKATEHASLISPADRSAGCIDLGCGSAELLRFLMDHVVVKTGLDYSDSMLSQARIALRDKEPIQLINANAFDYLRNADEPVWITCAALNQYLTAAEMLEFLNLFSSNRQARSLYLFDCVDPLRYRLLPFGLSYRRTDAASAGFGRRVLRTAYRQGRRARLALLLALGFFQRRFQWLGSAAMGYGYLPAFWIDAADAHQLEVEFASSRHYEYRYHVILRKNRPSSSTPSQVTKNESVELQNSVSRARR